MYIINNIYVHMCAFLSLYVSVCFENERKTVV